ncbi:MAG: penicillin-binding protein 1C [Acidobacteria bacterium]|jgi:penicillin-binding protein 1C|nr:penicillin-binding protein 1C [Acidobacteriota bacterium]
MGGDRPLRAFIRRRRKALLLLGGGVLLLVLLGWWTKPRRLFNNDLSPVLFSADGRLLGARLAADEQWRFPRMKAVPRRFFQALLQYEDRRFYRHRGVDLRAIARAMLANMRKGSVVSGGSTLTMQVVRISRGNPRRTYREKLMEMLLALRLELSRSKKEILDLHAANAPFGGNIVGIDAAAWLYFNRGPEALSWAEAAFLAVLPNDPKLVAGAGRRRQLKAKRDRLLGRLLQRKFLSPLECDLARAEPLPAGARPLPRLAPHLLDTLAARPGRGRLFPTFIRAGLQETLNRIVQANGERLLRGNIRNLAALVVDNRQATVVAYAGNVSRAGAEHGQDVDLVRSPRSTGSILKPFLYAAMLQEGGLTPATLLADTPVHFAGYVPENFDRRFRGAVPARDALAWSLNIPAIRMLQQFGIPRFYNLLKKWGLSTLTRPPGGYGLTLVLGGAEGTLFDITGLYAGLAQLAQGDAIVRRQVRLLQDEPLRPAPLADLGPAAAYLTLEALTEVNRPDQEGFWKQFSSSKWVAWKTGTSFGLRDAWAVGVTPAYTVGIWAGNADGEGNPDLTGLSTAAPVLFDVLQALDTGGTIPPPRLWLQELRVCRDSGFLAGELCPVITVAMPRDSHFQQPCTFHQLVHLDAGRRFRVDSSCESPQRMVHEPWFVLPPVQEYYYRRSHPGYRPLPPFRRDCAGFYQAEAGRQVISLVYPDLKTAVYVPVDLDGRPGQVVFEAIHRRPGAVLYWHLGERYLGATRQFHQLAASPAPGEHLLVLIDEDGHRLERRFRVIGREN